MAQISFRVSDDIAAELERGRVAQHFSSQVEYISALILGAAGRVSGLSAPGAFAAAAADARVGGAVTNAIALIEQGEAALAIGELRFAQDVILAALVAKRPPLDQVVADRMRIRGGGDDWAQAERQG